uniref:AAA domain-containing protein, putative AbiEii toxin, Type IV TA system n=1 Tax=Candidatus Kentrum sp. FM TaxID=2126340 RepID=A0A450RWG2_9GAMM|nr:MAG: AAA domain-containing protein, putative AbiEii toxin, Type IV TA system [Candidatus Kentron sp. FM]VFJ43888.1 MAG: AAA domain-containing protein, putative AbiEii toxin, Type IV TA system [Candidatus Kentron sp. FM]VFK05736.1 MAG: AAA domain-containing protein, putative AbiEii toxin, Type IV TA system [Candidatus Kentron sp. FM]
MRLKSLEYTEFEGAPEEWILRGFTPGDANLLVGKNASGKSRVLNIIHNVALAIAGKRPPGSNEHVSLVFNEDGLEIEYGLKTQNNKIIVERFTVGDETKLDRGAEGKGKIYAEEEGRDIAFQSPENQLAVVTRRDTLQHPFFDPLHRWADSLYYYAFGTSLGKVSFWMLSDENLKVADPKKPLEVVGVFHRGENDFGEDFVNTVLEDFRSVGYPVEEIGLHVIFTTPRTANKQHEEAVDIYVQETDLPTITDQNSMSQGMFRALSILIQLNYAILADTPSCILIDDIGEGLDFDRSRNLIDLLMRKVENSPVQLIMATNDRFVMNHVPLEAWSVVDRQGSRVTIRDYANSREIFDQFKFTGLSNFDFLAFDYLHADADSAE